MMKERVVHLLYTPCSRDMLVSFPLLRPDCVAHHIQANIVHRDPREERSIKMERVEASSLPRTSKHTRSFIEGSTVMKTVLKVVGVFGVSLVMSGMICQTMSSSHL